MGIKTFKTEVPIAEHELEIGHLMLYPNIVVGEIKEGMHIAYENFNIASQILAEEYKGTRPFIYISNRTNSYSMDPVAYKDLLALVPNLKGFAVVAKSKRRRMMSNLERIFIKKPMRVFETMDEAFEWSFKLLEDKN